MAFDLFSLDILDEDVTRFREYRDGVVIEGSCLTGKVAIVSTDTFSHLFRDATCYTPEEMRQLLNMSVADAQLAHDIKRKFRGTLRVRK
jgi:hypothetical protein